MGPRDLFKSKDLYTVIKRYPTQHEQKQTRTGYSNSRDSRDTEDGIATETKTVVSK